MPQIIRSNNLEVAGLTKGDYDSRKIVAVGWFKTELLPPYEDLLAKARAKEILSYLKGKRFKRNRDSLHAQDVRRKFQEKPKLVEVVGGLVDGCVSVTAHYLLGEGIKVLINPSRTFHSSSSMPDYWLGRLLLRNTLFEEDRRCLIYGRDFIFYRS